MSADRTQAPTPRRRRLAREQGRVPRSAELSSAIVFLGAIASLAICSPQIFRRLVALFERRLSDPLQQTPLQDQVIELQAIGYESLATLLPVVMLIGAVAFFVQITQIGFLWLPNKLLPDLNRVNPAAGVQRIVSFHQLGRLLLQSVKIAALAFAAYLSIQHLLPELVGLSLTSPDRLLPQASGVLLQFATTLGAVLLVFGTVDYILQKLKFERDLQMSPEELREEIRAIQNDVSLSRRRRSLTRPVDDGAPNQGASD